MDIDDLLSSMCDDCHINPANVHLTHVEDNETETYHLCEECARRRGIPLPDGESLLKGLHAIAGGGVPSLGGALGALGGAKIKLALKPPKAAAREPEPEPLKDVVCRGCGLAFSEFRSSGILGCAECYGSFDEHVDKILVQVHGAGGHKGKRYGRKQPARKGAGKDIELLRKELDKAVKNEEFELAARLRDVIKSAQREAV